MNLTLKMCICLGSLFLLVTSCNEYRASKNAAAEVPAGLIKLLGKQVDTTYLKILNLDLTLPANDDKPKWKLPEEGEEYNDVGAELTDSTNGKVRLFLEITGKVNNRIPGIYFIRYSANDATGKSLASVTRTVYVVESQANFLNGNYDVVCTCTVTSKEKSEATTTTYTANVTTSSIRNNHFELSKVNVGAEQRSIPITKRGELLDMDTHFNPVNFHQNSFLSGRVSSDKKGFTIDSEVQTLLPSVTYKCKNLYTKQTD